MKTNVMDIIGYIATGIGITSSIPQIYQVIQTNDTSSISLGFYIMACVSFILWIIYGSVLKLGPVRNGNILMLLGYGYVLYRKILNISKGKDNVNS